ncbi:50S ribosomal protein L21e [Acidianus sulfidivorans JP7]|uniref:Large ribosomal subunit protein eL21 n=1 Tax=Acidianus sulfidivorans JP7 TaxID=619593 RepID=A0A2U9IMK5_9CREN|nr:50S ribosomal protein L21e [Acidianus sulfidivorans]AWR97258.1 50S ribosomal protein L21e [Acidianus sulfidivorans JP7]
MVAHSKGNRTRSRNLLKKSPRERGSIPPLSTLMYDYKLGDKVVIKINPSIHSGMPHRRYHGKVAEVIGKRGKSYLLKLYLGNKEKVLIVSPEHMKLFSQ